MGKSVKFKKWNCVIERASYADGSNAVRLIDDQDASPVATASVYLAPEIFGEIRRPNENQVYIKTWSENAGLLEALVAYEVVKPVGTKIDVNGHNCFAVLCEIL